MKYVLFTGATGGIGMLCVKTLSDTNNWMVFATSNNEAVLDKLLNFFPKKRARYIFIPCSLEQYQCYFVN